MFSFTLDGRFFFDREDLGNRWYAYTPPAAPPIRDGYFAISDGQFLRNAGESSALTSTEIREIERYLGDHVELMDVSQFAPHSQQPNHYRPINQSSNRFSDILRRMRIYGEWDVNTSVALEEMVTENPAYRLTREFVQELLNRASRVSKRDHDEWLGAVAMDSWTYGSSDPRRTFAEYFGERKTAIYRPDYNKEFRSDSQELYAIDGLPALYYFRETTAVANFNSPSVDSRHFVDLDSVVAPVPLPSYHGSAYYIL